MYNKSRCIENIYVLAKKKGLKIGVLEEKAGVSKGYLSRINKEGNTTNPPIDLVDSIAGQLGVSMDYLLSYSSEGMTENDEFLLGFIDKLLLRTNAKQLEWIMQAENFLPADKKLSKEKDALTITLEATDTLNTLSSWGLYEKGESINSHFYGEETNISGDGFYCELFPNKNTRLYIMTVVYKKFSYSKDKGYLSKHAFEIYICNGNKINPLCSTAYIKPEIEDLIKKLYTAITSASSRIGITQETKSIMQKFINE